MLLSSTFISTRETARPVTVIVESYCCLSQARPWPEFYLTASLFIIREVSYQRAKVASGKNTGLSTWCSLLDSSKGSVGKNADLHSAYVDLTKAFDTVSRDGLWRIMAKKGCPQKFFSIVRPLHDSMLARVQDNGEISQPFPVSNGVKQGCVLAPTLFSIICSVMLTDAFRDTDVGIGINQHTDGSVFNLRRLQAKTKVTSDTVNDFVFADDCSLNAASEAEMQYSVDRLAEACNNFGLTISINKTEVMHHTAPGKTCSEPNITMNGQRLNVVDKFAYRGSTLLRNVIDDEVNATLAKVSAAYSRLHKKVWNRKSITLETMIKIYQAIVLTTLLHTCEPWTVYQRHARKLNPFHTTCLGKLPLHQVARQNPRH